MSFLGAALLITLGSAALSIVFYSYRLGISPTPTSEPVRQELLRSLPKKFTGTIYELGAGWGGLAITLAKRYPDHQVIAVERSPIPYLVTKIRALFAAHSNLEIRYETIFSQDLSTAGLIVCYLYPGAMQKLQRKFGDELSSGTYIISNTFSLPDYSPLATSYAADVYASPIYLYRWDKS